MILLYFPLVPTFFLSPSYTFFIFYAFSFPYFFFQGGTQPGSGHVGIPSILVTKACGDFIKSNIEYLSSGLNHNESGSSSISGSGSVGVEINNDGSNNDDNDNVNDDKKNENNESNDDNKDKSKDNENSSVSTDVRTVTGILSPAQDSSGFDRWIDLSYTEWTEGIEDQLVQLEGIVLTHRYCRLNDVSLRKNVFSLHYYMLM